MENCFPVFEMNYLHLSRVAVNNDDVWDNVQKQSFLSKIFDPKFQQHTKFCLW